MAWLTVFALFAQALAPLSSALAHDANTDGAFQVICTASGVKTIAIGQDGQPVDPGKVVSCPFCVVHSASALIPPLATSFAAHSISAKPIFALPSADGHASLWRVQPRSPRGPPQAA